MRTFYITTPIYYVNAQPHLGHAYSTIVADSLTRLHKMMGEQTLFLTGTDEHGDKIVQAAEKKNLTPQAFVDEISASFNSLWPKLSISHDRFERTTSPLHKKAVQLFLQKIYDAGDIYFGEFGGYYCYGCERFYTEKELVEGLCPQHQQPPQYICEKNYFFRMSKYLPWLKEYLASHADLIRPERYRTEALAMLDSGELDDLCISRPKSRLTWGIELPFDKDYVCYVWFDALIAYISGIGWPGSEEFRQFWPGDHLIAKDILKPHAIFWPCMLKAADLPVYKHLDVHGYWLARDVKMSKSLGNVVEPLAAIQNFGLDAFRYFLLRDMRFGSDASFNDEAVIKRINSDLANDLGNLFSRVLSMNNKYFNAKMPASDGSLKLDDEIAEIAVHACSAYVAEFANLRISQALEKLWELISALNKYVDKEAPWALQKSGNAARLQMVMATLLTGLYKIAVCLWPVMPESSAKMLAQLGEPALKDNMPPVQDIERFAEEFAPLSPNRNLAASSSLFPRLELKPQVSEKEPTAAARKPEIDFSVFESLDMAVGTIVAAEKHPQADRLLRLEIDFGEEKPRQIISGLAEYYMPQELQGQQVCAVLNLKPRKIRGLMSHGMVLTAQADEKLALVQPQKHMPNGSRLA